MAEMVRNNDIEIMMKNIGMVYQADGSDVTALTNVSLDIHKGEFSPPDRRGYSHRR